MKSRKSVLKSITAAFAIMLAAVVFLQVSTVAAADVATPSDAKKEYTYDEVRKMSAAEAKDKGVAERWISIKHLIRISAYDAETLGVYDEWYEEVHGWIERKGGLKTIDAYEAKMFGMYDEWYEAVDGLKGMNYGSAVYLGVLDEWMEAKDYLKITSFDAYCAGCVDEFEAAWKEEYERYSGKDTVEVRTGENGKPALGVAVENVNEGGQVILNISSMDLGRNLLKKAAERNVTVVIDNKEDGYKWTISPDAGFDSDIQTGIDMDASVEAIDTALKDVKTDKMTMSFAHSGDVPTGTKVTVNVGKYSMSVKKNTLYLYYYNDETDKFKPIEVCQIQDGMVTFTLPHCSDYILTGEPLPDALVEGDNLTVPPASEDNNQDANTGNNNEDEEEESITEAVKSPKTADNSHVSILSVLAVMSAAVMGLQFFTVKRKEN